MLDRILIRVLIAYAIFTLGLVLISIGMYANGSAAPWNPTWPFIAELRNICVLTWIVPAALAAIVWGIGEILTTGSKPPADPTLLSETEEEATARREQDRIAAEERARVRATEIEQLEKEKEQMRLRQEKIQRQAEEKRKVRTAEEAAKSALGDFL